jgi:hypothetical protein
LWRSRSDRHGKLFTRLEETLGAEHASTLMTYLPPVDFAELATKRDLEQLEQRFEHRFELIDQRFELLEQRLIAVFRGELNAAVSSQTRAMIFTMAGTVVSLGGLALALARLG